MTQRAGRTRADGDPLEVGLSRALGELGVAGGQTLGVACSGGGDSVALLHLASRVHGGVVALHVDHRLRPGSGDDAAFVGEVAAALGLSFLSRTVTVRPHDSVEAAAREARYAALSEMAREAGIDFVLTAHTRDDQAETVLMRLIRGATLDAISPARGIFLRPLLDRTRAELRTWLSSRGIAWREDPTNDDLRFERNWVRAKLMPLLLERRGGVADVLARTATRARDEGRALDAIADAIVRDARHDDVGVLVDDIDALPRAFASRVLRRACRSAGADPSERAVEAMLDGRARCVGCGDVEVWRIGTSMAFLRASRARPAPLPLPTGGEVAHVGWGLRLRVCDRAAEAWTWRTSAPDRELTIRPRLPGDRVSTPGGTRKVQDVLVDGKVPRALRDLVPILATADGAFAVIGHAAGVASSSSARVVDVEPIAGSWSRELAWTGR